jgi:hypothetical protein
MDDSHGGNPPMRMFVSCLMSIAALVSAAEAKQLSRAEVIATFGGKRVFWSNAIQGGVVQFGYQTFSKDMTFARGVGKQGTEFKWTYVDKARFKGDLFCYQSKAKGASIYTPSPPICVRIVKQGEKYIAVKPSGRRILVWSLRK